MSNPGNILSLSHDQAREFFLRESSFCRIELPKYFSFSSVLSQLSQRSLASINTRKARDYSDVNYTVICNKDGKYAWRPQQIINPVIYVKLVQEITQPDKWKEINKRFAEFQSNPKIQCVSIPVYPESTNSSKAEQILTWWDCFEQRSIQFSLEYSQIFATDITDCYGSIYTHSIAWAMHGKELAKGKRNDQSMVGNFIDILIEDMSHGQTNGIPQGSILMDFIAEIVLGYIDLLLSERLQKEQICEYQILRYRDDYRIFVNNQSVGEAILKDLTEILYGFGMRLNASKTKSSVNVISSSIKEDKLAWLKIDSTAKNLNIQKRLLLILEHSICHPNCGSLLRPLNDICQEISPYPNDALTIVSIITEIAYRNPRTYSVYVAILAKIFEVMSDSTKKEVAEQILRKFNTLPNTEYIDIWLQRILFPLGIRLQFSGVLPQIVEGEKAHPWNFDWVTEEGLMESVKTFSIIDKDVLSSLSPTIPDSEIDIFLRAGEDY